MKTMFCKLSVLALAFLMMLSLFCFAANAEEITVSDTNVTSDTTTVTETVAETVTETAGIETTETGISETEITETETTETTADDAAMNFNFMPDKFVINLKYMAAGMVGIFLVIGVIVITILILGKLTAPKNKDEE